MTRAVCSTCHGSGTAVLVGVECPTCEGRGNVVMGDRLDVANVEAVTWRQSAMTPAEALAESMFGGPVALHEAQRILDGLPAGWALVDTRAVGTMAGTVMDALVTVLEDDEERLWAWAIR